MSAVVSLAAFVVLCFSYRACNARSFGVVGKEVADGEFHHSFSKKSEALNPARVSTWPDTRKSLTTPNGDNVNSNDHIIDPREHIEAKGVDVSEESVASASWKVPLDERKRNEQVPGFNLDYLPPKTHPPIHN